MIGTTDQNKNSRGCQQAAPETYCFEQGGSEAYKTLFSDPKFKFSSTFYASALGESKRLSSLRAYFKNDVLVGIVLHPDGVGGNVQPEVYGTIPTEAPFNNPKIYIEFGPKEHITAVNWSAYVQDFNYVTERPGHLNPDKDQEIVGPRITGIQIVTNKGRVISHSDMPSSSFTWKKGLGRSGYAITGFHGLSTLPEVENELNYAGIVNLGAWLVKESELP